MRLRKKAAKGGLEQRWDSMAFQGRMALYWEKSRAAEKALLHAEEDMEMISAVDKLKVSGNPLGDERSAKKLAEINERLESRLGALHELAWVCEKLAGEHSQRLGIVSAGRLREEFKDANIEAKGIAAIVARNKGRIAVFRMAAYDKREELKRINGAKKARRNIISKFFRRK